jgi:DNA-binding CsgD family transcriptional regulator
MPTDLYNYDVYGDIGDLETSFDVFKYLRSTTETFRLHYFVVLALPGDMLASFANHSVISNWPPELIKAYDKADMINVSPVISALRRTSTPVVWEIDDVLQDDVSDALADLRNCFCDRGFMRGVNYPVTDSRGLRGAVGFAGDRHALENGEILELSMISLHVFNRLSEITFQSEKEMTPLSDRELECLRWTAVGKTSSEIATILGLSEHTVNHYLIGATKKLDAVNRTQAVAKSIRRGWI